MKKKSAKFGAAPRQKCALETPMTESSASAAPSSSARSWDRAIAYDSSVCIGFNNDSKWFIMATQNAFRKSQKRNETDKSCKPRHCKTPAKGRMQSISMYFEVHEISAKFLRKDPQALPFLTIRISATGEKTRYFSIQLTWLAFVFESFEFQHVSTWSVLQIHSRGHHWSLEAFDSSALRMHAPSFDHRTESLFEITFALQPMQLICFAFGNL